MNLILKSFCLVALSFISSQLSAQTVSPWQIHRGDGPVDLVTKVYGDQKAYEVVNIPNFNDAGWETAPKTQLLRGPKKGELAVGFNESSSIAGAAKAGDCKKKVDFTYFKTEVFVPKGTTINKFKIYYNWADDGARIYLFNSKHPKGYFNAKFDLIVGDQNRRNPDVNLSSEVVPGEINTVIIAQFDNCPTGNSIRGINIEVNGNPIVPEEVPASDETVITENNDSAAGIFNTTCGAVNYKLQLGNIYKDETQFGQEIGNVRSIHCEHTPLGEKLVVIQDKANAQQLYYLDGYANIGLGTGWYPNIKSCGGVTYILDAKNNVLKVNDNSIAQIGTNAVKMDVSEMNPYGQQLKATVTDGRELYYLNGFTGMGDGWYPALENFGGTYYVLDLAGRIFMFKDTSKKEAKEIGHGASAISYEGGVLKATVEGGKKVSYINGGWK